ncbi:discoidin domain-containing protein, partial [Paenibacillus ehimensis]|uniref:discoidin domain-containing protein n=1 Tax=Paenibacillus ehimensis TaxID=79264 RepID=UPI003D2DA4F8
EVVKLTDKNSATVWSSAWRDSDSNPEWVALDLGTTKLIGGISLTPRGTLGFPKDFKIQTSSDAITWTDIPDQTYSNYVNNGSEQTFNFGSSVIARYIRVYATRLGMDDAGGYYFQLADFNVNLSNVAASSSIKGWEVVKLIDKNPVTVWSSTWHDSDSNPEWVALDLGTTKLIGGISLTPRGTLGFPKDFKIQTSGDAITWTDIPDQAYSNYVNNGSEQTFNFGSSVIARYIRVYATRLGMDDMGGYYFQLADFNVVTAR